ncbi:endonuclease/exonuclease/phosphatase family protein [Frigidibacter sp. SD6-1]|uniref:endonuclease/exonuclease/phosphatase family protein n=1 Tax=Frigidibacter sp. SD6-1 TaxID=3032581 RepID=UPI0024DFAC22|nr:endonuclease/exonuclease/phosphatase family protein [Frigidibacter sp. SD6-1]
MKRAFRLLGFGLVGLLLIACAAQWKNSGLTPLPAPPPGSLRVATHNAHYIVLTAEDGPWSVAGWEARKGAFGAAFRALDADIVAYQEMESFSRGDDGSINLARDYLLAENPGYRAAATGDWRRFPSTQPIFYRTNRLSLLDQGWFFFSETPEVIYSRTFDGSYPAFASWARFAPKAGGTPFIVLNLHFDYSSRENRRRSAALVRERLATWLAEGEPVILIGDLNERAGSAIITAFEAQGLAFAQTKGASYHFNRGINLFSAIDHIALANGATFAGPPVILRQKFSGQWPSDHYPVVADITLP